MSKKHPFGKNLYPFGKPKTPFDPSKGHHWPLSNQSQIKKLTVSADLGDKLFCHDSKGNSTTVIKPYTLRYRAIFRHEGITYQQMSPKTRVVTFRNGTRIMERIKPPYMVGEEIFAIRYNEELGINIEGVNREWYDINNAGRRWDNWGADIADRELTIVSIGDDALTCEDGNGDTVYVAKPYMLRRTPFDNLTVDGVDYVYSDASTRVASKAGEDDETQLITPDYYAGEVIKAQRYDTGLTVSGDDVEWEEELTVHSWSVEVT